MADFRAAKVVGSLPDPLTPNTIYLVRAGEGFDLYCSDTTGAAAHKINAGGVRITVSPTPPASPQVNDIWIS